MNAEIIIVGGGLAGAAAAILLARSGSDVLLLEREAQPQHKVCGEFLSHEALAYLHLLGVDLDTAAGSLGSVPIHAVRIAHGNRVSEAALPFSARSLTRRTLDAHLLQLAEHAGARVLRGCRVLSLDSATGGGWNACIEHADGAIVSASTAFLATGKHDLSKRPRPSGKQPNLVAFKMYFRLAPAQAAALAGHVELMLYRGGYGGLQPVEDNAANLCCLIHRDELQRLGGWPGLLSSMQHECALLRERLLGATPLLERPLAISAIPYGYVRPSTDGLWALGDQAAVIPSFTGDGMSIALHSGCLAASMYLRGQTAQQFQQQLRRDVAAQVALATALSRGMVWPPSRRVFTTAVAASPGILSLVARGTRIPGAALTAARPQPVT